jgi:hypothetical protein
MRYAVFALLAIPALPLAARADVAIKFCLDGTSQGEYSEEIKFEYRACGLSVDGLTTQCGDWTSRSIPPPTGPGVAPNLSVTMWWPEDIAKKNPNLRQAHVEIRFDEDLATAGAQWRTISFNPRILDEDDSTRDCDDVPAPNRFHFRREGDSLVLYKGCYPELKSCPNR